MNHKFKIEHFQNSTIENNSSFLSSRTNYSITFSQYLKGMLIFGGKDCKYYNDLYFIDMLKLEIKEVKTKGKPPTCRINVHIFADDDKLFIFGGINDREKPINDIFVLNLTDFCWKKIFIFETPKPRLFFSSCFYDNKCKKVDFSNNSSNLSLNESLSKNDFEEKNLKSSFEKDDFEEKSIKSDFFSKEMYIFGGVCLGSTEPIHELWQLDLENVDFQSEVSDLPGAVWSKMQTSGEVV